MLGSRSCLVAVVCMATAVLAEPKPPTEPQKQAATELVKKAIAKSQAGDHDAAIRLYLDAYALVPNAILLSNVGSEFRQSQKPVEALRYFCMYLDKDPTGAMVTYVTAQAREVQHELKQDGEVCAKPAEPKKVEPVKPVDPQVTATKQPIVEPTKPADGGKTWRIVGIATGGVGLATLGAGIYFGVRAQHFSDEITHHDTSVPYQNLAQIQSDGQAAENKQIIFDVAGGALTVAGVVMYFVGRSKHGESQSVSLVPTSNGFALAGGF
jgi:tetratricopeptide (TPR) repeat protein